MSEKKPKRIQEPDPHRLLPQAPDSEKGLLCSFLLAPREIGAFCEEAHITEEAFAIPAHATIFAALREMWQANQPIDFIILTQKLRNEGKLDQCGGAAFITELFSFLPTAANARHYSAIIKEKGMLRSLIKTCTEFAAQGYEDQDDAQALIASAESAILAISKGHESAASKDSHTAKELVIRSMEYIDSLHARKGQISGVPTGFKDLDRKIDGLHGQEMIVIAARPSMGKTALAMGMVEHIAIDCKIPVGVFSLEMSADQLMNRAILSRARVDWTHVRDGFTGSGQHQKINRSAQQFASAPIKFNDKSGISPAYIAAVARRWKREIDIQAIFIDYLQLVRGTKNYKGDNRQSEVAEISSGLKGIAKELGIPVVVLAQLNRNPDQRTGTARGKPRMSDLRESGAIEADADVILLLSREEFYSETDEERESSAGKANLNIAKQRNGPTGDIPLTFIKEYTRFETMATDLPLLPPDIRPSPLKSNPPKRER